MVDENEILGKRLGVKSNEKAPGTNSRRQNGWAKLR